MFAETASQGSQISCVKDVHTGKPSSAVITVLFARKRCYNNQSKKSAKNVALKFIQPKKKNFVIAAKTFAAVANNATLPMAKSDVLSV